MSSTHEKMGTWGLFFTFSTVLVAGDSISVLFEETFSRFKYESGVVDDTSNEPSMVQSVQQLLEVKQIHCYIFFS